MSKWKNKNGKKMGKDGNGNKIEKVSEVELDPNNRILTLLYNRAIPALFLFIFIPVSEATALPTRPYDCLNF